MLKHSDAHVAHKITTKQLENLLSRQWSVCKKLSGFLKLSYWVRWRLRKHQEDVCIYQSGIQTCGIFEAKDGSIIENRGQKLDRWIERYSELYGTANHDYVNELPDTPALYHLDNPPEKVDTSHHLQSSPR